MLVHLAEEEIWGRVDEEVERGSLDLALPDPASLGQEAWLRYGAHQGVKVSFARGDV